LNYRILGIAFLVVFFGILIDSQDAFAEHIAGVQNWADPSDLNQQAKPADLYTIFVSGCGDSVHMFKDGVNLKGWLKSDLQRKQGEIGVNFITKFHYAAWHWFNNHRDPDTYTDLGNVEQPSVAGPKAAESFGCGNWLELTPQLWNVVVQQAKSQLDGVNPPRTCYHTVQNSDGSPYSGSVSGMERCEDTQNQCTEKTLSAGQCKKIKCVQYKSGEKPPNCSCGVKTAPTKYWSCSSPSTPSGYTSISDTKIVSKIKSVKWKGWTGQEISDPIIPRDAKVIIMGHSLGGHAAYRIATEVDRDIDLLYLSDPVGPYGQRVGGTITPNVKHFEMRYQTNCCTPVNNLAEIEYTIQDTSQTTSNQKKSHSGETHASITGNDDIQNDLKSVINNIVGYNSVGSNTGGSNLVGPIIGGSTWSDWKSAGCNGCTNISAVKETDGRFAIVSNGPGGDTLLNYQWDDIGSPWYGWSGLGAGATYDVAITQDADAKNHIFSVAANGNISYKELGGTGANIGCSGCTRVDATSETDGSLVAVASASPSVAWINYENTPGGDNWSGWIQLGSELFNDLTVTKLHNGALIVIGAQSPDGMVMFKYQIGPGGDWSGWNPLGNSAQQAGTNFNRVDAMQSLNSDPVIVGTKTSGEIYIKYMDVKDSSWTDWIQLDGTAKDVSIERNSDGRYELFIAGTDTVVYHKSQLSVPSAITGPEMITRADSDFFDEPDPSEMEVMESKVLRPKQQVSQGISAEDVTCKEGLQKLYKSYDGAPICVTESGAKRLIQMGWAS